MSKKWFVYLHFRTIQYIFVVYKDTKMNRFNLSELRSGLDEVLRLDKELEAKKNELKESKKALHISLKMVIEENGLKPKVIEILQKDRSKAAAKNYYSHTLVKNKFWNLGFIECLFRILQESDLEMSEKKSSSGVDKILLAATG